MPIEVRQRCYLRHVGTVLLCDECQPQSQLGEAHRRRGQIDPEQRPGENVAFHGQGRAFAGGTPQSHELIERPQKKGT